MLSTGLTDAEVRQRRQRGQVNRVRAGRWREYAGIFSRNVLTWFNALVVPAALVLLHFDEWRGAVAVSGMMLVNTILGLAQELAAKIRLDRLTLLSATQVHVIRSGQTQFIPTDEIVQDDIISLSVGEYIAADGPILEASFLEVDEALLTGESDPVPRQVGENLLAGSFCVAGSGLYRAEKVGAALATQRLAQEARRHRHVPGPIQQSIDHIIRWLSYVAIALTAAYLLRYWLHPFSQVALAQMVAATVTSLVPQGLVLTATLALTWGAIRLTRQGAIVQRLDAVEAMAAVDVVCLDKTGTLTTNQLRLEQFVVLDETLDPAQVRRRVQEFLAAALDRTNKVLAALRRELDEITID
jgi:cation-transporting ATPase E